MKKKQIKVYTFYRFVSLNNIKKLKLILEKILDNKKIKGTILLANEGINGSLSGLSQDIDESIKLIKSLINIRKISLKINTNNFVPFYRLRIRLKKEIVSLGVKNIDAKNSTGKFIKPSEWNSTLSNKKIKIIDTRNQYETNIGKFKNAIKPKINTFKEFPKIFEELKFKKEDKIAMYCTGGIRCEKASSYLIKKGYKNIVQLEGGILNYLQYAKTKNIKNNWEGECFVFDNRVAVDKTLNQGSYNQCHGCRHPITKKDIKSKYYKKGIHCPKCYNNRSINQFKRSETRQKQIDKAEKNKFNHNFRKIYLKDMVV